MRKYLETELDIGINETRDNFRRRLGTDQRGYMLEAQKNSEALFQSLYRDIEMATTVNQLKPVLLALLQEAMG